MFENPIKLIPHQSLGGALGSYGCGKHSKYVPIMCYDGDVFPSVNTIATTTIFLMNETGVEPVLHI